MESKVSYGNKVENGGIEAGHDSDGRINPLEISFQRANSRRLTQINAALRKDGLFAIKEE